MSRQTLQEIKQASELVGQVFMDVWPVIRALDEEALLYYGFPQETIKLVKYDPLAPFLDFPKIPIAGNPMTVVWGAWLYNNGSDRFSGGSVGIRVSEGRITDDYSYWCPIGC